MSCLGPYELEDAEQGDKELPIKSADEWNGFLTVEEGLHCRTDPAYVAAGAAGGGLVTAAVVGAIILAEQGEKGGGKTTLRRRNADIQAVHPSVDKNRFIFGIAAATPKGAGAVHEELAAKLSSEAVRENMEKSLVDAGAVWGGDTLARDAVMWSG